MIDEILQRIGTDTTPIEMVTTPARLFILISHLQLALRHPGNTGSSAEIARTMAHNMSEVLCQFHPEARQLIEQGWHPEFDMSREEWDEYNEPSRFPKVNEDDPNKPGVGDQF